ncbi:hypothetical protein [Allorhodopirellula heiligendammensis]|uniref:Uncharacterized protein n=1 Tax=Allorhodopirellula heiligendammensis TaxID=2714739 RepID=A0A5C6BZ07_9BACT|nr:hypothetical protein [Allorhodopirellula heiligendammensis]TWU16691.1 hypothetical protein Poly21_38960 [Allorhodopirellula heiligendammensis]
MNQSPQNNAADLTVQAQVSRIGEINRCGSCDACCTALGIADDQLKKISTITETLSDHGGNTNDRTTIDLRRCGDCV